MTEEYYSQLDTNYSIRYQSRNKKKISRICEHIRHEPIKNALDIGCNQGYVIKTLLEKDLITKGFGVDLDKKIVDPQ